MARSALIRVPAQRDPKKFNGVNVKRDPKVFWLILGPAELPRLTGIQDILGPDELLCSLLCI